MKEEYVGYNSKEDAIKGNKTMRQHATKCEIRALPGNNCDCDGYHTFEELYGHRIALFVTLCRFVHNDEHRMLHDTPVWRSKFHSDGSSFYGWFIMGIGRNKGEQITYHLPLSKWDETDFAETLDKAPEFDGHTPDDVLERLKNL